MKKYFLFLAFAFSYKSYGQIDTIIQRLFLIGDAGELKNGKQPVLDWLTKNVNWNDEKNVALFLGDNIYPDGLPDEGDAEYGYTKKVIDYQINLVKGKKGKAFFVPGNHDWKGGKIGGWERAMNQVNYINSLQAPNIQAWPLNGCPGPIPVELNEKVVLVMMDSQWFLHIHDKPGPESNCGARTVEEFTAELRQIAETHPNQLLVLVMHHPMYTYGTHGGAYGLKQHIFPFADAIKGLYIPLPVLGSVYPLARGLFGSLQDTYHPLYRTMINEIEQALKDHPNPIAVAGHEHSLQLIIKDSIPYVVSGSAAKLTRLRKGKNSLFSTLENGFSVLEIRKSGKLEVKFYNLQSDDMNTPLYAKELKTIAPVTTTSLMDTLLPVIGNAQVKASKDLAAGPLKRFLWGQNYRSEWTQSISVPMLDLGNDFGGLKPVRQQGAQQTRTLTLAEKKKKKKWLLRSIEKFPQAVIPSDLRSDLQNKTLLKGVSGAYPYASLSVPILENAAGIPTLRRRLVYVPDDPRLERFRTGFKNTLAILEELQPSGIGKTYATEDLVLLLAKDNDDHVDQKAVLRARLMDNFVMDFDRHEGQYRWATRDTGKGKIYFPIPRDHDQAFFKSEGLITGFLHQPWFMPQIQGFRPKAYNIKTFNKTAANFDRFFLTELSAKDWQNEIDSFLNRMTDEVIEKALQQQPQEVRKYNSAEIIEILKKRRAFFREEMMTYYRFISKKVNVVGSNKKELFILTKQADGKVLATVNKLDTTNAISSKIYERVFDPAVTKELRIYALEGNDSLVLKGPGTPIKISMVGGPGNDAFRNEGSGKRIKIYDASFEQNTLSGNTAGFDNKNVSDPEVNRFNRNGFKYDYFDPGASLEYNKDDGIRAGVQLEFFKQGFRKEPYGMRQYLRAEKAFGTGGLRLRYESDYIKAVKNYDVSLHADFKLPEVTNFFGLGNNSVLDKGKGIPYYRTRYTIANAALLFGKQLQSWMRVGVGPAFQFIKLDANKNEGKYVSDVSLNGLNATTLFQNKIYLGAEGRVDINSRNNASVPTRGALIKGYARQLFGINSFSKSLFQTGLDIRIFMSFVPQTKLVFATRVGMARNFGGYEFQQGQYLSGTENLRGFRRERFAGRSLFFNNSEVRIKLLEFPTYIFSGAVGILAFHDIGRVWSDDENSGRWHNGYGGGIWLAPIRRFVIVGSFAFSKEEKAMPILTLGFHF